MGASVIAGIYARGPLVGYVVCFDTLPADALPADGSVYDPTEFPELHARLHSYRVYRLRLWKLKLFPHLVNPFGENCLPDFTPRAAPGAWARFADAIVGEFDKQTKRQADAA